MLFNSLAFPVFLAMHSWTVAVVSGQVRLTLCRRTCVWLTWPWASLTFSIVALGSTSRTP